MHNMKPIVPTVSPSFRVLVFIKKVGFRKIS